MNILKSIMLTAAVAAAGGTAAYAQGSVDNDAAATVHFAAGEPRQTGGPGDEARTLMQSKVSQILNRNSAASAGDFGLFVVVPEINLGDQSGTSGLVQDVTKQTGELVLTAMNALDNTSFYSVTVPLSVTTKQHVGDPYLLLAKSIKITDPVYVRFVRNARQNIQKYYEQHCDEAMSRTRTMTAAGNIEEALQLLYAIPPSAPCADEARLLTQTYRAELAPAVADTVVVQLPADTVVVEKEVVVKHPVASSQSQEPKLPKIFISEQGWDVKVLDCKYLPQQQQIRIELRITATDRSRGELRTVLTKAISSDGDTYEYLESGTGKYYYTYPDNVPVKASFLINRVSSNPGELGMVEVLLGFGNVKIEIRNLAIE